MGLFQYFADKKAAKLEEEAAQRQRQASQEQALAARRAAEAAAYSADSADLKARLKQSPLMDALMAQLEKEHPWVFCRQGSDDFGSRYFEFTEDTIHIEVYTYREVEDVRYDKFGLVHYDTRFEKIELAQVTYSYTKSGYAPLSSYKSLSTSTVLHHWKQEWIARMKERIPQIKFSDDSYTLPVPTKQAF